MKKIFLFLAISLSVAILFAQPVGNCKTCFPAQSGNTGKYLQTNGTSLVWSAIGVSDSVPWLTGNGNTYLANPNLNVGIGTNNPLGKLTVVNDAQNVVFGSLYSSLLEDNAWGTEMTDSCYKYGYILQNPNAPNDHLMVMYSIDTCNGEGVQLMVNHDAYNQEMGIIMNYDNPDTNKTSRATFNSDGFRHLRVVNDTTVTLNFQITPTGQMVYTKGAGAGKVLTSDASGNADWQFNSTNGTTAPGTTPTYIGQFYINTSTKKLYVATGTSSSADWTITN